MALFQPTNITPDMKGGVKNGVILIPSGVLTPTDAEISWSVNGNSKMTAYQIDFYQNTAASTQTGTTGKITLSPAFSAVSTNGTEQRFSATVAWSLISGTYAGTGTLQGKFKITQWWGSGANDYVEQRSLSVFEVSKEGGLHILSYTGYGGNLTFSGLYTPPAPASTYGNVPLNWARWQVILGAYGGEVVWDSGKIWNATDLSYSPPPLSPAGYTVVLSGEGANGAVYEDALQIDVYEDDLTSIDNLLTVSCNHEKDAVKITMGNRVELLPADIYGSYSQGADGEIVLDNYTSGVSYNVLNYSADKWTFIWHGVITGAGATLIRIQMASGEMFRVQQNSGYLAFTTGSSTHSISYAINREYWIIFTNGYFTDDSEDGFQWIVYSPEVSGCNNFKANTYTLSRPKLITIFGPCTTYGFQLGFGVGNSGLKAALTDNSYEANFAGPKVNFPFETDSYDAAWLPLGDVNAQGALYRMEGPYAYGAAMNLVGLFPPYVGETWMPYLLDYAAVNGKSWQYAVTGSEAGQENSAISYTAKGVEPCFWNWLLIEAAQDADNDRLYEAVNVFRFQGNVSSGSYSNGGGRNIQPTFTQYPAVLRSTQNRRQGTLSGLIGYAAKGEYSDTNETEQAIRALSTSRNQLFLRDRRGNFMKIALAGEISMSVNDNSAKQEITASIPWIETGSAYGVSVYETGYDEIDPT